MGIRRVVTGHDNDGKAVFASDETIDPVTIDLVPGVEFYRMWGTDQTARFPDDGTQGPSVTYFPPAGGLRFVAFSVPPDGIAFPEDFDIEAALVEVEDKLPGLASHMEPDNPGMHTTATIDYDFVVSGRVVLELDNGVTKELRAGDTVVQNGTRHAWRNPFDETCLIVVALIAADHDAL